MTAKRWGAHALWWAIAIFQLTELNIKANSPCFQYARQHEGALNDATNYAQNECAMQMWGMTLNNYIMSAKFLSSDSWRGHIEIDSE